MMKSSNVPYSFLCALMLTVFGTALCGCGEPMQVESHWGPGLRFSEKTRTYQWSPVAARISGEGRPQNPKSDELIRQAIEKHLALKGYEKAASGPADFLIDYSVGRRVRGNALQTREFTQFTEGTLVLDAYNPENSQLIWRGTVQAALDDSLPPDERLKRLDTAVKTMLDKLPSRPKSK
jgi:hypothetical protein